MDDLIVDDVGLCLVMGQRFSEAFSDPLMMCEVDCPLDHSDSLLMGQSLKKGEEAVEQADSIMTGPSCMGHSDLVDVNFVDANIEPELVPPMGFS